MSNPSLQPCGLKTRPLSPKETKADPPEVTLPLESTLDTPKLLYIKLITHMCTKGSIGIWHLVFREYQGENGKNGNNHQ